MITVEFSTVDFFRMDSAAVDSVEVDTIAMDLSMVCHNVCPWRQWFSVWLKVAYYRGRITGPHLFLCGC